jgi:glucosamine-6-phosphate deaminase
VKIRVFQSPRSAARALARDVAQSITSNPQLVLGLPTGRTPIPLYRELVSLCRSDQVDFSEVTTFNLDEFLGVAPEDPGSYRAFMQRHLFDHVNLSGRRTHFLDGSATDVEAECKRFERAIDRAGGLDLIVLGLGRNGHIGFNEPGRSLVARTHRTRLRPSTRRANAFLFGHRVSAVPRHALSMGMATIFRARRIVLFVTGPSKASSVERVIHGPITPYVPASFLQLHRGVELWLDARASSAASSSRKRGSTSSPIASRTKS